MAMRFALACVLAGLIAVPALAPAWAQQRGDSFGAIAYGAKTLAWGAYAGATTADEARQKALTTCSRRADDCQVVTNFSNTCAAVAVNAGGVTFVQMDARRGNAENFARQACLKRDPAGCRIADSICAER